MRFADAAGAEKDDILGALDDDRAALFLPLARRGHLGPAQRPPVGAPAPAAGTRRATPSAGLIERHIVTDTQGFLLAVRVHEANIQDPHGAVPLLHELRRRFPELGHIVADRVYRGRQLQEAVADCGPCVP